MGPSQTARRKRVETVQEGTDLRQGPQNVRATEMGARDTERERKAPRGRMAVETVQGITLSHGRHQKARAGVLQTREGR